MGLKGRNCDFCIESSYDIGQESDYGAIIVDKIGTAQAEWFATLSPKTGSDPERDFSVQLIPSIHVTHFSEISFTPKLAENYGIIFSRLNFALARIMQEDEETRKEKDPFVLSVGTYGKSTTYPPKREHLHLKLFPFKGNIGQPYTVDSSFGKKEIFTDETGAEFVKMNPVRKVNLSESRLQELSQRIIQAIRKMGCQTPNESVADMVNSGDAEVPGTHSLRGVEK